MRINKYLAEKKYATRLGADDLIRRGLVTINGKKAVLGAQVNDDDMVVVKKSALAEKKYVYFVFNKPRSITTHKDLGAPSILEFADFPRGVFPIGRLDKDSHGLILMTNDGRITDPLLNPDSNHEKEYRVVVNKDITDAFLSKMGRGVKLGDGYKTKPCTIKKVAPKIFTIILTEGKNRQIRRMCEVFDYHVVDLERTRIMNVRIGGLKEGYSRPLSNDEEKDLLRTLGLNI